MSQILYLFSIYSMYFMTPQCSALIINPVLRQQFVIFFFFLVIISLETFGKTLGKIEPSVQLHPCMQHNIDELINFQSIYKYKHYGF